MIVLCRCYYDHLYTVGYVVLGSNGECAYLTPEERVQIVEHVRLMTPADRLVIAGAGAECKISTHITSYTVHCHCHCLSVCLSVC